MDREFRRRNLDRVKGPRRTTFACITWVSFCPMLLPEGVEAAECSAPGNVDWVISQSCEITTLQIAPSNVSVVDGAVLTVESSGDLVVDMRRFAVRLDPDARLSVAPGGRVRSNQIGPLLVRGTDSGGTIGYFLKRVGGPVIDALNPDLSFYPASAIKVLYMLEALRQVDSATLNLTTTNVISCPTTITAGAGQSCPNSFTTMIPPGTVGAGSAGNCSPTIANSQNSCGGPTQNFPLGLTICAMMKVSNNAAANAIQERVSAPNPPLDPQVGWTNIVNNAGNVVGLTATSLANRFGGCGGFNNNPSNQTTLRDFGRIYEAMATNPTVLFPANPPTSVNFPNTTAYNFMLNDGDLVFISNIIAEQGTEIGLSNATVMNFQNAVRLAHKPGNVTLGGIQAVALAGWVSLPINGGSASRDYVYGIFINGKSMSSLGLSLLNEAAEMLRPVIRDALEDF